MSIPDERGGLGGFWSALARRLPAPSHGSSPSGSVAGALKSSFKAALNRFLHGVKYFLPDRLFLFLSHRRRIGRFPDLKDPKTFNEIILDRCLHPDPRWTALADKLAVREYVKEKIGEKHLIPLIAAPDVFTREVFESLPDSFVMKANHGCAFVKVVWDKSQTSFDELSRLANQWLAVDFYRASRERHYRAIVPRIYFEQILVDRNGKIPADIKMNVFGNGPDGPVIYTGIISDRFGAPRHDLYDDKWKRLDIALGEYPQSVADIPRPSNWEQLVDVATRLTEGLGYVRVDLYTPDDEIYFGELTFTPGAGVFPFSPDRHDHEWGRLIRTLAGPQGAAAGLGQPHT